MKDMNINNFVWKDGKIKDEFGVFKQSEKKLILMSEAELKKCYEHCKTMLFNSDSSNPGRFIVLDNITEQKNKCGTELFLRYLETLGLKRFELITSFNEFLKNNKDALKGQKVISDNIFNSLPGEYKSLPLSMLMDGCLDKLGAFNKKHITRAFILRQGIWLTTQESKDLIELDEEGNVRDRLEVIRERLELKDVEKLYVNSKGLSYTQIRAMIKLKPNNKYSELSTNQLETLRYRILFNLEESVKNHIASWEQRMEEIELVSTSLGFKL